MGILETRTQDAHQGGQVDVSVVFPALNEADIIESAVEALSQALTAYGCTYEIIIAEDGSTDGTDKKAAALAEKHGFVRHLHGEKRLGRGRALKNSFKQSNGNVLIYMDVDLATDLKHLGPLIDAVSVEGYQLATGSRMLSQSKVKRTFTRGFASKTYNFMVRLILGSKVKDHQCGFKAFQRESTLELLDEVEANHWFWDTEILVRAQRKGYRVKEIPVEWSSGRETKVRLFKDSFDMGWQILVLWKHLTF
jgi:glycosyltransferase involved in cell wall biosynthesis